MQRLHDALWLHELSRPLAPFRAVDVHARLVRHPRDEVHERVEVVILEELARHAKKRKRSHRRQKRARLPPRALVPFPAAVRDDLIVRVLVEATQRVLARHLDAVPPRGGANLSKQSLRPAARKEGMLDVSHLRARKVQPRLVLRANLHDRLVPVPLRRVVPAPRVEVPRGELRGVRPRVIPPVHPRAFQRQLYAVVAGAENAARALQHPIAVLHELAAVPGEEKLPVLRVPRPEVRAEEPGLVREVVVPARVVRPRAAPLDVASLAPRAREISKRALVVALKLADAGELPLRRLLALLVLRVRRISKLAARPAADGDLREGLRQPRRLYRISKAPHEVAVAFQWRPPLERLRVVRPQRDDLRVAVPVLVREEQVRVVHGGLEDPPGELHLEVIADVGAARVKRHHRVELQPGV
mmetsp:Transcript_46927/g.112455  ORF Transcript_46927/g.112455 Transcript_46927/m.112455 type:complete len:414 (-) Transcript_46927:776-2017(-)